MSYGRGRFWSSQGRLLTAVVLIGITAASVATFGLVFPAYTASEQVNAGAIEASVGEVSISDDGKTVRMELKLTNPTPNAVQVTDRASYGFLQLYEADQRVSILQQTTIQGATIPADGSAIVRVTFTVQDEHSESVSAGLSDGNIRGRLPATVAGKKVQISLGTMEVSV